MNAVHKVTGYDKTTRFLTEERDIPGSEFGYVKELAHVAIADEDAVGSYLLSDHAVTELNTRLGLDLNNAQLDWFFEPFQD